MLREFIRSQHAKNRVIEFSKEVLTEYEIAALMAKTEGKISIFKRIKNYKNLSVVSGIASSRDLIADAIGAKDRANILFRMAECMDNPKKYRMVDNADFFENKIDKPDIIRYVPLINFYKKSTYYTSATIVAVRNPETDKMNYSFHRMMYLGKNKFVIRMIPGRHLATIFEEANNDLDVVIFCGVHPAVGIAAATSFVLGFNEMEFANALLNNKLSCVDVDGCDIPAHAELVMVGKIRKDEKAREGPFVDLTGTWDIVREQHVVEISTLYHRNNFIYQSILPGGAEHRLLMGLPQEPRIYKIVSNTLPRVKNVVLTEAGGCWLHGVVSIKKKVEGEGKNVGLAALAAHPSMKRVVVVDDDIDITDEKQVEWAIATRVQADKDVVIIPGAKGSSLDPSQDFEKKVTTKWIIDATAPAGKLEEFSRVRVESEDEIDLTKYL